MKAELIGGKALITRTSLFSTGMMNRLRVAVARLAVEVVARVKGDKLSDQVLHVRSGRLRRSITFKLENSSDKATAQVGTNLAYGRAHEYGFTGAVTVRAHMRQTKLGPVAVRAHTMNMNLPERSFLRSTLNEMREEIRSRMAAAVMGKVTA